MEPRARGYSGGVAAVLDGTGQYKSVLDSEMDPHGDDGRLHARSNFKQISLCLQVGPCKVCVSGGSVVRATDRRERSHSSRR